MTRAKIGSVILSALGTGLLLAALVLWARMQLSQGLSARQEELYLAYEWLPEPTPIPITATLDLTPTLSVPTPLPSPNPTPQPQPPTRLAIPKIGVNSSIRPVSLRIEGDPNNPTTTWEEFTTGVAHYRDSANPGEAGNIILLGHNNTHGEVFRRLSEMATGDTIFVYTLDRRFSYVVIETDVVRAVGATAQDKRAHSYYLGPKPDQTLTLVSCWPYATYTHRVYVVAELAGVSNQ
jgi:sortase A